MRFGVLGQKTDAGEQVSRCNAVAMGLQLKLYGLHFIIWNAARMRLS